MEDLPGREGVPQSVTDKTVEYPQVSAFVNNLRSQKVILRSVESEISNESVSESILDSIEKIEQLYKELNIEVPETMIYSYAAVALAISLRCLPENTVENILERRISKLEMLNSKLVTDDLRCCRDGMRVLQSTSDALNKWKERDEHTKHKEYALIATKCYVSQAMDPILPALEEQAAELKLPEARRKRDEMESIEKETNTEWEDKCIQDCETGGGECESSEGRGIQGEVLLQKQAANTKRRRGPPKLGDSDDLDSEKMGASDVNRALVGDTLINSKSSNVTVSNPSVDESIGIRIRLDSPKRKIVSPLKIYEDVKFTKRRPNKIWSPEEEDALREGVKKLGVGNWKAILNSNRDIFSDRGEVDLKDKWRNLMRPASRK